jgi:hypothetical protein
MEIIYGNACIGETSLARCRSHDDRVLPKIPGLISISSTTSLNSSAGYTRLTAETGLEFFMPKLDEQTPKKAGQSITLEWQ